MFSIHSLHIQAAIAGTSSSYSQLLSGLFRLARLNPDQAPTALCPAPGQIRLDRPLTTLVFPTPERQRKPWAYEKSSFALLWPVNLGFHDKSKCSSRKPALPRMLGHSHLAADKMGKIRAACLLARAVHGFSSHSRLTTAVCCVFTPSALRWQAIAAPLQQVQNL